MAAVDPGIARSRDLEGLIRRGMRLAAVACYCAAILVAFLLVRPAFRETPAPVVEPVQQVAPTTDKIRKGESVATFAARHGLELGDLLALNPKIDSLSLRPGTELRIG
jgi:LysM repeat protein